MAGIEDPIELAISPEKVVFLIEKAKEGDVRMCRPSGIQIQAQTPATTA